MDVFSLNPGSYMAPTGSDVLWWLVQHIQQFSGENRLIVLPTQRAANRLKGLLYKAPALLVRNEIRTYDTILGDKIDVVEDELRLCWDVFEDPYFTEEVFKTQNLTFEQKKCFLSSIQSLQAELGLNEIALSELLKVAYRNDQPVLQKLITTLIKKFPEGRKVDRSFVARLDGFVEKLPSIEKKVYLLVDGVVPPAVHRLAEALQDEHYVLASGKFSADLLDSLVFKQLPVYIPRRKLQAQLQSEVPKSVKIEKDIEGVICIETLNILVLARQIVEVAQQRFALGDKVVSLVTSNRQLSSIIHTMCDGAEISIDDSFGRPLDQTSYGQLILLMLSWMMDNKKYERLLNLISHPVLHSYWGDFARKVDYLGRSKQLKFLEVLGAYDPKSEEDVQRLDELKTLFQRPQLEAFKDQASEALSLLKKWGVIAENYSEFEQVQALLNISENLEMFRIRLQSKTCREQTPRPPYLQLMGPMESRLMHPKTVILADFNEGEWPEGSLSSPWLNVRVRQEIGLPDSVLSTDGLSHAFLSLMGSKYVFLCRSAQINGLPATSSRWWSRLSVVCKLAGVSLPVISLERDPTERGVTKTKIYQIPDHLRPQKLSISDIHLWINDPRLFVQNRLLEMKDLPEWDESANHLSRGILIHEVLEQGINENLSSKEMLCVAMEKLKKLNLSASESMFWESDLVACVRNFEQMNQSISSLKTWTEIRGEWTVETQFGYVNIVGKADRVDQLEDGSFQIIDYKTGGLPSKKSVIQGDYPQLVLLGLMLKNGAFAPMISKSTPFMVSYWGVKSGEVSNFLFEDLEKLEEFVVSKIEELLNPDFTFEV